MWNIGVSLGDALEIFGLGGVLVQGPGGFGQIFGVLYLHLWVLRGQFEESIIITQLKTLSVHP